MRENCTSRLIERTVEGRLCPTTFDSTPILGMRPGRTHRIVVVVTNENGVSASSEPLELTTDPLPDDFPPIEVSVSRPDLMELGVTLLEPDYSPEDRSERDHELLVAVDEAGEVVWYYQSDQSVSDARRMENGNLFYMSGGTHLHEIDMLGNRVSEWHTNGAPEDEVGANSINVDTERLHHEAFPTPLGNILALGSEVRTYEGYPTSDTDREAPTATADLIGDVLVEFTRQGKVVHEVGVLDLLDPYRIGYNSIENGRAGTAVFGEPGAHPRHDWTHGNAVVSDPTGRYAIASLRHQDAVVKVDMETGELIWILGNHGGWGPEWQRYLLQARGDLLWPYH